MQVQHKNKSTISYYYYELVESLRKECLVKRKINKFNVVKEVVFKIEKEMSVRTVRECYK